MVVRERPGDHGGVSRGETLEEMVFAFTPIWVRVSKMPFGMMNKATGYTRLKTYIVVAGQSRTR
jgi:hypothetical protein